MQVVASSDIVAGEQPVEEVVIVADHDRVALYRFFGR